MFTLAAPNRAPTAALLLGKQKGADLLKPRAAVLLGVLAVSFAAPLIKLSTAPAPVIAFYRMFLAAGATLLLAKGSLEPVPRPLWWPIALAGVFLGLHFVVWIASLSFTSVLSSVALVTLQPVIVALASRCFFREHLPTKAYGGIALAVVGGLVLAMADINGPSGSLFGDLLALLGAVFISGYLILGRVIRRSVDTLTYTFWVYTCAALAIFPVILLNGAAITGYLARELLIFLALAVICTLLGHSVFNWALAYLSPTIVTVAILGEPIGACLWDYLLFGQIPGLLQLTAGTLLLTGVALFLLATETQSRASQAKAQKQTTGIDL